MGTDRPSKRFVGAVAGAVIFGWIFSFGVGAFQENWTPLTITTPVMFVLAGYAFGIRITRGGNGGEKND